MSLAALYKGKKCIVVSEQQVVAPARGEVSIKPAFTGICGTDLHIYHGDMDHRVRMPAVIGHEMSGTVSIVGEGVEEWDTGDPVTVIPVMSDGSCSACRHGYGHACENLRFAGIDSPGSMQEEWVVPADNLIRLPENLALDHAALVEPTAVAVHDVRRAALQPGEQTLVVGGGPIGLVIALVARVEHADVVVVEPDPYRRCIAARLGFRAIDPYAERVEEAVADWTGGAGVSVAFEVSGVPEGMETAVGSLGVRGRVCLVAIHPEPRSVDLHRFFLRELSLVAARLYDRSDFQRAIDLVASDQIPAPVLITRVERLSRVTQAFEALETGGNVMKILIDCSDRSST